MARLMTTYFFFEGSTKNVAGWGPLCLVHLLVFVLILRSSLQREKKKTSVFVALLGGTTSLLAMHPLTPPRLSR